MSTHQTDPANAPLPAPFDDYEVHGVKRYTEADVTFCEQVDDAEADFWSLYGHMPGRGLDCIGDFGSRAHAEEVYARITGRRYGQGGAA
jgi:hypothetical protein